MTEIDDSQLRSAVESRFYAVNGIHPMTAEDDSYVTEWYIPLESLAQRAGVDASELRRLMLANRLPLPSYIRSDGAQMVARDLLELPRRAGGYEQLPEWLVSSLNQAVMRSANGTVTSGDTTYVCVMYCLKRCNAKISS